MKITLSCNPAKNHDVDKSSLPPVLLSLLLITPARMLTMTLLGMRERKKKVGYGHGFWLLTIFVCHLK